MGKQVYGDIGLPGVIHSALTLSLVIKGKVARTSLKFTFAELERRTVVDFQCGIDSVRAILKQVDEHGSCSLGSRSASEVYVTRKVLAS
jgi:hypothetical protein